MYIKIINGGENVALSIIENLDGSHTWSCHTSFWKRLISLYDSSSSDGSSSESRYDISGETNKFVIFDHHDISLFVRCNLRADSDGDPPLWYKRVYDR